MLDDFDLAGKRFKRKKNKRTNGESKGVLKAERDFEFSPGDSRRFEDNANKDSPISVFQFPLTSRRFSDRKPWPSPSKKKITENKARENNSSCTSKTCVMREELRNPKAFIEAKEGGRAECDSLKSDVPDGTKVLKRHPKFEKDTLFSKDTSEKNGEESFLNKDKDNIQEPKPIMEENAIFENLTILEIKAILEKTTHLDEESLFKVKSLLEKASIPKKHLIWKEKVILEKTSNLEEKLSSTKRNAVQKPEGNFKNIENVKNIVASEREITRKGSLVEAIPLSIDREKIEKENGNVNRIQMGKRFKRITIRRDLKCSRAKICSQENQFLETILDSHKISEIQVSCSDKKHKEEVEMKKQNDGLQMGVFLKDKQSRDDKRVSKTNVDVRKQSLYIKDLKTELDPSQFFTEETVEGEIGVDREGEVEGEQTDFEGKRNGEPQEKESETKKILFLEKKMEAVSERENAIGNPISVDEIGGEGRVRTTDKRKGRENLEDECVESSNFGRYHNEEMDFFQCINKNSEKKKSTEEKDYGKNVKITKKITKDIAKHVELENLKVSAKVH